MAVKDAAPEDVAALPQDFAVPSYNENNKPLYDNQLFPAVNSAEDLIARGYATPDGQVTENGQMALSLKKVGALNDDYTLNDTGKAMMASREDLLKEENLPLYMKSKELGLDGTGELSWGDTFNGFLGELKKGGKELVDLIEYDTKDMTPEEQAEYDLRSSGLISGAAKMGAALPMGVAKIAGTSLIKGIIDDEQTQESALASFNQKFERTQDDINNTNTAEFVDALGEISGVNLNFREGRENAIALVGEEKAREFEGGGESAGGFAATFNPYGPAMLTAKVAFGVAGKGLGAAFQPISRSLLQADAKAAEVLAKTKQLSTLQRQASGLQLATQAAEKQAATAESMAQKFSQAGFTDRANNALRLANQARTKGQEAAVRLGGFTDEIATVSDDLAKATQSATVADKVLQMTQKAGQIPYLPITLLGKSLEYTGRGMIGIDKGLSNLAAKVGADKAYNAMNKITTLSGLGGVGVASGLGPAAFIPAAIKATWSTAPFIKATGEYVGLMGKEAMKARSQIGFWKRMYEMPNKGPMHRAVSGLMDTATLGGRVTGAAGRVGKGLAASYPVDLAFEWVAEGGEMNPNVLKQAAVETLVFGGTGAALGGITMGSAERIRSLQNGDATNFYRSITDPSQRVMFNGMAPDLKRAIGTFSASNPGAKVEFVTQGEGVYDRNTKTVMVNPNARNPLKPLLTHEFMHHMLNNGIGDGVVAQLVGDGYQTGGILRSKDGGYEQQYEEFKSEYVNLLRQQHERDIKLRDAIGDPVSKSERAFQVPDEKYLAEEYFIETNVDDMLGLVESGKLGKMAGRMVLNDKVRALGDAILNKSAILRDLHFRIGGVMDKQGKMVKGNGFLGGQLYQSPEIRRMFNKMVNESVGRRGGIDAAKMKARNGIKLPISGKNDPILGEMSSLWESDADGNPLIDKNGDYIPLSKQTDELRSQAGMLLVDDLRARQSRGEAIPDGELAYNPENNTWSGQYLNDKQIELLSLSGRFNSKQIKQLKLMNEAARATSDPNADPAARGHRFSVIYQAALKKNRKGQWRYDQIEPQLRDVVPYGVEISKDGNILIRIMSTNQLFANASEKAATKRGRSLYDGNMDSILRDANAIIDLHGKNQATDAYFKDKYGAQWASHKEFINSVFGNVGKGHKDINPLVASDRVDAVVKSYRLDRMNKATQLVGATQLPYQNNLIKINYLPEGEPILDANGEPKDLRYTPRYEERMPEQRYMPEVAVVPERFTGSKEDVDRRGKYVEPPGFFKRFNIDSYERGGRFFDAANGEDLTGKQYSTGSIDVSTGKPRLFVDNISDVTKSGAKFKTNLFKQSAGWKWTSENPPSTSTIVSVEGQGKHVYSLKANFESGVELARYSEKKSEPRLRPTAYGELKLGNQVGEISIRGKLHPVYDSIGVTSKAQGSRLMPEVSPEDLNPVANKQEAQGLWADGKRMFALNEMDERLTPITSKAMLDSYSADAIGWMEPEQAPAPSQRFMPEKLDADYMKAVERGDVGEQQKLVDEAAKKAGLDPKPIFRGRRSASGKIKSNVPYFTFNEPAAQAYAQEYGGDEGVVLKAYSKFKNTATEKQVVDVAKRINHQFVDEEFPSAYLDVSPKLVKALKEEGFDSVEGRDSLPEDQGTISVVAALYPESQIKSADPITRDDSGNIIPPSKRFDITSNDLRFMPEGVKATPAEVLQELDSTNFIPRKMAAKILGPFPDYLTPVADFIAKQREKLVSGSLTSRDVWKAYAVTVASQGTGAVSVDLLKDKLSKVGIDFNPTDLFTDTGKSGQRTIRPEEAAAYWLGTPDGKRALDNAESGNTSPSDWDGLVQVRKAYGDDRFKTFNVFSDKNLSKIPVVVDQLNQSKGNSKQVLDAVQLLNGVSTGKKGFISHLLGLGNTPTIDAVEINFWLTGKGDVGTLKTKEADLARKIKDTFSDKRVREEMFNRVDNSINLLRDVAEGGKKVPKDVWSHVMHHWLWDKAKGLETTHAGMYEAQMRFMPEPLPANYQSSRDTTFLYQSIGPDGIINLTRPIKSTEALPTISTRHEYPMEEFTVSKFDKRASILYTKNKNGEDVAFKFDPQLMKKPEFANFDDLYDGAVVQLAMADRHGATDGDMGGHAFPDLKVNQDILVDDGNGKQYKLVWSNNAWGPVKNMSTKAQKYGATTLLTYNMDPHAHDSNTRTVRIFSNEIANSNLSAKDQSTLLIVMNVALKKAQSSASKQDLRAFLKDKKDLVDTLKKDDKIKAKSPNGDAGLGVAEREALLLSLDDIQKQIDDENQFLKESLGVKLAGDEEVKVDSLFRNYQNKRRAYEKNTKSESRKKAMVDAEKELKAYQKTKEFKKAESLLPSRELDKFSNTFKGRKSLIIAVKNKEASVKWNGFDSQKISQAIGDQLNGDSLHIVSSVELSSDPDFKAVYLGDDPREIARMSPQEKQAAQQLKSNQDFVPHEAYLWSMLGPAESKHIYNTNQRSVLESFPDFVNEYSQLPVKPGKLKLNDPNSKASEFNIVNTIRDQSKIKIVFRAKQGRSD